MSSSPFPPEFFQRVDEAADDQFYREPRFVTHVDDATIAAITNLYREMLPDGGTVLDLMSSWISHLPTDVDYGRVAGLGMNHEELAGNPQLDDFVVHDLNREPNLPYDEGEFDAVVNAVSVQYLTRPVEVFDAVGRVLKPGGLHAVMISHRMFPTKAVAAWQSISSEERVRLVAAYFNLSMGWDEPQLVDRSPAGADPLWCVFATRSAP
ncbi:MAG TPA: class I SAM-dependent methyltransferase [Dehalococcoidia bacterium]|nr:class I SAM-dependent methyltransferase [Dehalococcoidia bacterium]